MIRLNVDRPIEHMIPVPRVVVFRNRPQAESIMNCLSADLPGTETSIRAVFLFSAARDAQRFLDHRGMQDWTSEELPNPMLFNWLADAINLQNASVVLANPCESDLPLPTMAFDARDLAKRLEGIAPDSRPEAPCRFVLF